MADAFGCVAGSFESWTEPNNYPEPETNQNTAWYNREQNILRDKKMWQKEEEKFLRFYLGKEREI